MWVGVLPNPLWLGLALSRLELRTADLELSESIKLLSISKIYFAKFKTTVCDVIEPNYPWYVTLAKDREGDRWEQIVFQLSKHKLNGF